MDDFINSIDDLDAQDKATILVNIKQEEFTLEDLLSYRNKKSRLIAKELNIKARATASALQDAIDNYNAAAVKPAVIATEATQKVKQVFKKQEKESNNSLNNSGLNNEDSDDEMEELDDEVLEETTDEALGAFPQQPPAPAAQQPAALKVTVKDPVPAALKVTVKDPVAPTEVISTSLTAPATPTVERQKEFEAENLLENKKSTTKMSRRKEDHGVFAKELIQENRIFPFLHNRRLTEQNNINALSEERDDRRLFGHRRDSPYLCTPFKTRQRKAQQSHCVVTKI